MAALYSVGQVLKGRLGSYTLNKEIYKTVWLASNDTEEKVIIKGAQHIRIHNERDALLKFQGRAPLRRLVDEIEESTQPPGIVLEHMDDDLLATGKKKTLSRTEIKHVAKIVLQALDVLHKDGYVHTDVKPSNILCNYKKGENQESDTSIRFSNVRLADLGSCVPETSAYATEGDVIGAGIFRSPEANLSLPWDKSTDVWSFGTTLISLFFGNYHIFSPRVDVEDANYNDKVLERNHIFFGPFPLSYTDFVPREKRDGLAKIMNRVGANRKPFGMIKDPEFNDDDKAVILRIMKLDPRDRPKVEALLEDEWFQQ